MPNPKLETYKNKATGDVYDYTDADAQGKLTAILDGTTIDSFSDVESALADKVDVVSGKGLSTNDYDNTEKAKVAGAFPRSEQAVLGAKSIVPNNAVSSTVNGVTLTVNSDKTVQAVSESTPTGNVWFVLCADARPYLEADKEYIISGGKGIDNEGYAVQIGNDAGAQWYSTKQGGGETKFSFNSTALATGAIFYRIGIKASVVGGPINNLFKPMIRLASDPDSAYAPYAMTNKKMTDDVNTLNEQALIKLVSNVDLNDFKTTGRYCLSGNITHGAGNYGYLDVYAFSNDFVIQRFVGVNPEYILQRKYQNSTWSSWYMFTGTEVQ